MENQKKNQKFIILLMGQYKNLFIRGAFPSFKKRKNNRYKKIIHYANNIIEIDIIDIDDNLTIEEQINPELFQDDFLQNNIIALFVIDITDDNYIIELNPIIDNLKQKYSNNNFCISNYILLGIIPNNFIKEQNIPDSSNPLPFFIFHKLGEMQKCFCYEMEETEEEIDYNIFFVNYAMFFWIDLDKMYSNEELREIIDKNTGSENKDIKIKSEKELKNIEDKIKKKKIKELSLINKEKDKLETDKKKLIKTKEKEENRKQLLIIDFLKKRHITLNLEETKKKEKFKRNNSCSIWNIIEENKKEKMIELYKQEKQFILRCLYCHEIPEIQILNDKFVEIKCRNYKDENHIGKENILNINQYLEINFALKANEKHINYNKIKCIYCNKNQNDLISEFDNFINLEQKEYENIPYDKLKNNFFYYYNENKIFFCNICRDFVCQKCKSFHLLFCKSKNENNKDIINTYENYDEIKYLIDEKIIEFENEVNLNKQFMPLYMFDTFCLKHKKPYNFYCENCNLNLCSDCIEHNNHNILNWIDLENILSLKEEEIEKEKEYIKNISIKINEFIQELYNYFNELIQKKKDLISLKEKIIINAKNINNNYNIYKNLKNINFNIKKFDEKIYGKESNIIKKLGILLDYFNESFTIISNKLFNEKTEEKIFKNTFLINDFNFNKNNSNYSITSMLVFNKQKNSYENKEYKENKDFNSNFINENILAFSTNNGDVNFYNLEKEGKSTKIVTFYLFKKDKGIFDMKKIKYYKLLCGGYEELKIVDIKINEKKYNIINIIKKDKIFFTRNYILNKDIILSFFINREINLIKYNDNKHGVIPWLLLNDNNYNNSYIDIDCINNNNYNLISLIKLKKRKNMNLFVISISNNEEKNNNDLLLLYSIIENKKNNIRLEKILSIQKVDKNENNLFEVFNYNLLICKLETATESIAIININCFTLEKIIKLNSYDFYKNNKFFNSSFFVKFKSIYIKDNYYISINNDLELIQWKFNYEENNTFNSIESISLNCIKNQINRFNRNKNSKIIKLLFFQQINTFIILTNHNLIFYINIDN